MPTTKKRKKLEAALSSIADLLVRAAITNAGQRSNHDDAIRPPSKQAPAGPAVSADVLELFAQARADLALDEEERAAARVRCLAPRVELGIAAERLLVDALAAVTDLQVCGLLGGGHPIQGLVCGLERLPETCAPLWGCFYGRQPFAELVVSLLPGPLDRMLALLVWRGARDVNELAWRRAIDGLAARARWMVARSWPEVAV